MAATNNIYPSSATKNVNFNLVKKKKKKNGDNYNYHHAHQLGGRGSSINAATADGEGCGLKQLYYCSGTSCSRIRASSSLKFEISSSVSTTPNLGVNILPPYTIFSTGSGSGSKSIGRRQRGGAAPGVIKVVASATTSDDRSSSSFLRFSKFSTSSSGEDDGTGVAKTTQLLSDIVWPAAGAFVAMAAMGRLDQVLAPKGLLLTVPPFGAVCTVLLVTPTAPAAKKYNMFVSQIGCAAIGVLAYSLFGPGWMARSLALAASIAFMISTGSTHPPAASLPLMFIDGVKFHNLQWWYALYPGAAGCLLLCLIQEIVSFMKTNYKF